MLLMGRNSFEIQTGSRNFQFIYPSDTPIEEYLQVLAAVYNHHVKVKEESEKKENKEVAPEEPKQE